MTDIFITIRFIDTEAPVLNVTNFPENIYVNQSITLPYSSVATDDFSASPTTTLKIYFVEDKDGKVPVAYKTNSAGKYVLEVEVDENGRWLKDDDGNYVFKTDANGEYIKIPLYEYVDLDDDNPYEKNEDGTVIVDINTGEYVRRYKLDENGEKIPVKVEISHGSGTFTPAEKGKYIAVYTVKDASGNKTKFTDADGNETLEYTVKFEVTDAPASTWIDDFEWTTLTIISACVGGASLLGIIGILIYPFIFKRKEV